MAQPLKRWRVKKTPVDGPTLFTPVELTQGKYSGCVLNYGKVELVEENDHLRVKFNYTMIENPNGIETDDEFFNYIGDILVEIMNEQVYNDPQSLIVSSNDEVGLIGND